jgi:hypothetical protein
MHELDLAIKDGNLVAFNNWVDSVVGWNSKK